MGRYGSVRFSLSVILLLFPFHRLLLPLLIDLQGSLCNMTSQNDTLTMLSQLYFPVRRDIVWGQISQAQLVSPLRAPVFSSRGGISAVVQPGFVLTVSRHNAVTVRYFLCKKVAFELICNGLQKFVAIYYTLDGSDPRIRGGMLFFDLPYFLYYFPPVS